MRSEVTSGAAGDGGSGEAGFPAFMPAMPQIQHGTLPVIASPVLVPVYFAGDDTTLEGQLDTFLSGWVTSSTFTDAVKEYGVMSASKGTSIVLSETAGATLLNTDIESWLDGKLNSADPAWGAVDATTLASEIFILYYPAGTQITYGMAQSCSGFSAYHSGTVLTSKAVANYIVVPRCAPASAASVMGGTFTYAWDTAMGSNGDVRKLTVTAPATASTDIVAIVSGGAAMPASSWMLAVHAQ